MASQLFYNGEDNEFHKKGEALLLRNYDGISSPISAVKDILKFKNHADMLLCGPDGLPVDDNVGLLRDKSSADERDKLLDKYGTFFMFKDFINLLEYKFGATTPYKNDIIIFNYDWRLDCEYNAKLLVKKIIDYDEVVIVAYSLGGLVASKALAIMKQQYSLKNIKAYFSVCVPYNGTIKAIRGLKTGYLSLGVVKNFLCDFISISPKIKKLASTFPSVYQLLPTREFFQRNKGFLQDHDRKEMTYFDMFNYLKDSLKLEKKLINRAIDFHNSLFIKNKHILDYIDNKYFYVGIGYSVPSGISIHNKKEDLVILKYSEGDGTVDFYNSAVPPVEKPNALRIYKINSEHGIIFNNDDFLTQILFDISLLFKDPNLMVSDRL